MSVRGKNCSRKWPASASYHFFSFTFPTNSLSPDQNKNQNHPGIQKRSKPSHCQYTLHPNPPLTHRPPSSRLTPNPQSVHPKNTLPVPPPEMSAPNAGRQSPSPERQSGPQMKETPAGSGKVDEKKGEGEKAKDQTAGLSSNPTHPLAEEAVKKTSNQSSG